MGQRTTELWTYTDREIQKQKDLQGDFFVNFSLSVSTVAVYVVRDLVRRHIRETVQKVYTLHTREIIIRHTREKISLSRHIRES